MDRSKFQHSGIKWLAELEMLSDPDNSRQLINHLKLNLFLSSKHIKEAELLIYRDQKAMLVLLELSWFARKFLSNRSKRDIFGGAEEVLSQILPSFRFRVTDDIKIMELAVARVKHALSGGAHEKTSNSNSIVLSELQSSKRTDPAAANTQAPEGNPASPQTDSEKQQDAQPQVLQNSGPGDRNEK